MREKEHTAKKQAMTKKQAMAVTGGAVTLLLLLLICECGHKFGQSRSVMAENQGIEEKVGAVESETVEKKVALTFDDGPHPYYTQQLLDGLKERGVHATFFVTGQNAAAYPEIIERMQEEGHLIGNHTYHHVQLTATNAEVFRDEIISTNDVIYEITGMEISYIRPPYGSWDKKYEEELNMFPVLWTVDPLDWCKTDVSRIVRSVVNDVEENDIILMHDQYKSSVTAALRIVDELTEEGYIFVTVEEILFD